MGNHEIALSFRSALVAADSLVAMARCDSAERGWQSSESACLALADLLPTVDRLLFDRDIRKHLNQCPPAGCTPDGAELADVGRSARSWHHLACDLAHDVARKAIDEVIGLDAVFLFPEMDSDGGEHVKVGETDDGAELFEFRRLKAGEKRAGRLAEALRQIRENGRECWPAMAGSLQTTGLTSNHFERVWTGVSRELHEFERTPRSAAEPPPAASPGPPAPATPEANSAWPPDDGWHFRPGLYAFRRKTYALQGKLWKLLKHLAESRFPSTAAEMIAAMGSDGAKADGSIRTDLTNLRTILRGNHKLPSGSDPIPCKAKGEPSAWGLDLDYPAPAKAGNRTRKQKRRNKRRISVRKNDG